MRGDLLTAFGLTIAFLLPGLVGLYALSFAQPRILDWFGLAQTQDATVGGFLFVVVSSLGTGVFVSGLRWLCLDWMFDPPPALHATKQRALDPRTEEIYQDIRIQHYQFYQFYANTLCALVLVYVAWWVATRPAWPRVGGYFLALAVVSVVLWLSARNAIETHDRKVTHLLERESEIRV